MFNGFNLEKLLIIGVVAVILIGPERMPRYAEALAKLITRGRQWLSGAKDRVKDEMGDDFDEIEWRKLDPRQYDPRRIIRDALWEDPTPAELKPVSATVDVLDVSQKLEHAPVWVAESAHVPFDSEAT